MKQHIPGLIGRTALMMTCCLALGGLASPAAAKTIVVTTLTDTADPPFNADGPCSTGTISNLPGVDGLVSLREAIIAASNTPGADTITFQSGGTIAVNFDDLDADTNPDPLPDLCGGHTRLEGDLNRDDTPDITLEGAAFPAFPPAAGIGITSSHNTISGLRVQHFPFGIAVVAGLTGPGTVEHTTVTNNIVAESTIDGIFVATGDGPGSLLAHTTLTQNEVLNNARFGIFVLANLTAAGSDTQLTHTTITDNEIVGNGIIGINMVSLGDRNVVSHATLARNTVSGNTFVGINVLGGFDGADENTVNVDIRDNTVTDNGNDGIRMIVGQDNSSDNRVVAQIRENIVEQHQFYGIVTIAGLGAADFLTGSSNNNELDVRITRNTVEDQAGVGIGVSGGAASSNGRPGTSADGNQTSAIVMHNTVEGNTVRGIELLAGDVGLASANTTEVRVVHNTVCDNGTDIIGEGGYSGGNILFPVPNMGTGNVLEGQIFQNTATMVVIEDGVAGNSANVTQFHNDPCP